MIARLAPSFPQLAAALFPVAGCTVRGYAHARGTRYNIELRPPQPFAGPTSYHGTGATCFEALARAVQLFHDSAHTYPATQSQAAAGSYAPPPPAASAEPDDDDEPERIYRHEMALAATGNATNCY